ncbi:MAG: tyrosine-type recombinase/integrase [Acidithiobacillus sp.]|nr:tyrosine-type recombinase/integrase [Acidithiobacillus sp.]
MARNDDEIVFQETARGLWDELLATPGVRRGSRLFSEQERQAYRAWLVGEIVEAKKGRSQEAAAQAYPGFLESLCGDRSHNVQDEITREALSRLLHDRVLAAFDVEEWSDSRRPMPAKKDLKSRLPDAAKFLQFLSLLIRRGNAEGLWQWCPPSVPMLLAREPTPFTPEGMRGYRYVQIARKTFWIDLQRSTKLEGITAEGRILVSALLYGGLADIGALRELLRSLRRSTTVTYLSRAGISYLELELPLGRSGRRLRRWFPDPLSEILILRYRFSGDASETVTQKNVLEAMDAYLHSLPKWEGKYLRARSLLRWIPQTLRIELPQFLGAYATGTLLAHAVRPDRWLQLHGHRATTTSDLCLAEDAILRETPPTAAVTEVREALQSVPWLINLRKILRETDRRVVIKALADARVVGFSEPLSQMFYEWAEHLFKHGSAYRHRLSLRTIRRYVSRLAALMLQMLEPPSSIETFGDASWRQLYEDLLDSVETEHQRALVARAIREWHQYLVEKKDASPIPDQQLSSLTVDVVPDARILGMNEFEQVKTEIARGAHVERHVQLPTVLTLVAILGFRCGLRRMEALRLRLTDCHLEGVRATLLIRPFAERSLKSRNATRAIPVHALLEPQELQLLREWVQLRRKSGSPPEGYVFVLEEIGHNPISQEMAMSRIHEALRTVTGDPLMHFHHLRHSFASHLLWRLSLAQVPVDATPAVFFEEREAAGQLYQHLFGHSRSSRKLLYALTSLLGHSGPEVSAQHYVHNLDLILFVHLQDRIPKDVHSWCAFAHEIPQSSLYRIWKNNGMGGIVDRIRQAYVQRVKIPEIWMPDPEGKVQKRRRLFVDPLPLEDLWRILRLGLLADATSLGLEESALWDQLSEEYGLSAAQLQAMASKAKWIYALRGNMGLRHHAMKLTGAGGEVSLALPAKMRTKPDLAVYEQLVPFFWKSIEKDPRLVAEVLDKYLVQAWASHPGYFLGKSPDKPEDVMAFRELLFDWGVKPGQVAYVSYDPAERSVWRSRWRLALHLHKGITVEIRSLPEHQRAGEWLHVYPRFLKEGKTQAAAASPGFTYLLVMAAIFLAGKI